MKLWTFQSREAWDTLNTYGVLRGQREHICFEGFDYAYQWMIKQMEQRIGKRMDKKNYPIWAWYQFSGVKHKKPNLKEIKREIIKGRVSFFIEFEIPDALVLLSDYLQWRNVLADSYLPANEKEDHQFYTELKANGFKSYLKAKELPDFYRNRIEKSWEQIFDLDFYNSYICFPRESKKIQAVLWELKLEWVQKVKKIKGQRRGY